MRGGGVCSVVDDVAVAVACFVFLYERCRQMLTSQLPAVYIFYEENLS
jgi:hypothetical protein